MRLLFREQFGEFAGGARDLTPATSVTLKGAAHREAIAFQPYYRTFQSRHRNGRQCIKGRHGCCNPAVGVPEVAGQ